MSETSDGRRDDAGGPGNSSGEPVSSPPVTYRDLTAADVPGAARLHRQVFRDYFLGHMGQRFLELFYLEFVDRPGNYGVVAIVDGRVVGAVLGGADMSRLYADFYRRRFLRLAWLAYVRFVRDPYVRRHVASRLPHVLTALRSRLGVRSASGPDPDAWPPAQLLSIGVAAGYQGRGIAEALTELFCRRLADDGIEAVGLSVFTDNERAIRFYEKSGWIRQRESNGSLSFYRPL